MKNKKLPPQYQIRINADIEHFQDDNKKFRKRKAQLIKLKEKPISKKSTQIIAPLRTPMIKETGYGNEN